MPEARYLRLEDLFGARLVELTYAHLENVIARSATAPVREAEDLDFKRDHYAKAEDAGADLTAMANTRGGIVVIGIDEEDGAATALTPVVISDDEERRIRQAIADIVFPRLNFTIHSVPTPSDPGKGVYLLAVPRSPVAPHAVRSGKASLRYYRRYGAMNQPLQESEVADLYRNRFVEARSQVDRLREVHEQGFNRFPQFAEWISLALVPSVPGAMQIRAGALKEARKWLRTYADQSLGDGPFLGSQTEVSTGYRRLTISGDTDASGAPVSAYAELHVDGAGFVTVRTFRSGREVVTLEDEHLVLAVFGMLKLLAQHAQATGSYGEGLVIASIGGGRSSGTTFQLGHGRMITPWMQYQSSRALSTVPLSEHTIDIGPVAANNLDRAVATRMILMDWCHAFGRPELLQISETGALRTRYWKDNHLRGWKGRLGLPEDPNEVESG